MAAVCRSLVDQGGRLKSEFSSEEAGVAGFETTGGARAK